MFVLIAAALGGGIVTAALVHPHGVGWALAAVPFGGSAAALAAGVALALLRGPAAAQDGVDIQADIDAQTDAMVASLREAAARGRAEAPAAEETGRRDVA
ncbi:hypothetical protein [Methylobacterium sp. JK268]